MTKYALVGSMGGTDTHFALHDITSGEISQTKTYLGLDYPSLEAVIHVYLKGHEVEVKDGCIAIVRPTTGGRVAMTNHTRAFPTAGMKKNFGFSHLKIINNFTAVSVVIPTLRKEHLTQFGGTEPVGGKPTAVHGAGAGLGVAYLVHVDRCRASLPGEGGRVDFMPNSEEEGTILETLRAEIGYASTERALSGPGLMNLYHITAKADNHLPENLKSKDITERALTNSYTDCRRALSLLYVIMGRFGGNLAPNPGIFGGVPITDSVVPRPLEFSKAPGSRAAFEDKGRSKEYVHDTPVCLIVHDNPGPLGSDVHLHQILGRIL